MKNITIKKLIDQLPKNEDDGNIHCRVIDFQEELQVVECSFIQEFMDQHLEWAEKTFGVTPTAAPLHHLLKEIDKELIPELAVDPKFDRIDDPDHFLHVREEFADCFILLMHAVKKYDISFDELYAAVLEKFEKNKKRTWGAPDENGVSQHIKE